MTLVLIVGAYSVVSKASVRRIREDKPVKRLLKLYVATTESFT